jgi:tartrate dehydrogenase/decarboxylase / D-malate dehydrogenase
VRTYKIAAIPGDGIGKEVVGAGLEVLKACAAGDGGFALDVTHFDWSSERYKKTGALMPADGVPVRCGGRAGRA